MGGDAWYNITVRNDTQYFSEPDYYASKAGSGVDDPEQRKGKVYFEQGRIPYTSKLISAMEQYLSLIHI